MGEQDRLKCRLCSYSLPRFQRLKRPVGTRTMANQPAKLRAHFEQKHPDAWDMLQSKLDMEIWETNN